MVPLKNGTEGDALLVEACRETFRRLLKLFPVIGLELVAYCRDASHPLQPVHLALFEHMGIFQAGVIQETYRDVVLSSCEGEGLQMTFSSPILGDTGRL